MSRVDSEAYWDQKARENALYFVDNEVDYSDPDTDAFWRRGDEVVDLMLDLVGLSIAAEESVLDIGCGVGRLTRALAKRSAFVYGLDVSGEMLKLARQHNGDVPNIEWLHGDGSGLGAVPDSTVDGCFSHVVFQHIPDPAITLNYVRDMGRVLRPGGWALFQVSTDPAVHRLRLPLRTRVSALLTREQSGEQDRAWWGSAVELAALRAAADQGSLDVQQIHAEGSQYTTVLLRRRGAAA